MFDQVINSLNKLLSSTYALYFKTQNYHWNVTGAYSHDVHKIFELQYISLAKAIDNIAEQIRVHGHIVPATFKVPSSLSIIYECNEVLSWKEMVNDLSQNHLLLAQLFKEGLEITEKASNQAINELYIQRIAQHKREAWLLKAIIELKN